MSLAESTIIDYCNARCKLNPNVWKVNNKKYKRNDIDVIFLYDNKVNIKQIKENLYYIIIVR